MQRFTVKKTLTKMVGIPGWIIYRDSENGMYALNEEKGIDVNLMTWNITLNSENLDRCIKYIRQDIMKAESEEFSSLKKH